jgi:hypothetical protein
VDATLALILSHDRGLLGYTDRSDRFDAYAAQSFGRLLLAAHRKGGFLIRFLMLPDQISYDFLIVPINLQSRSSESKEALLFQLLARV